MKYKLTETDKAAIEAALEKGRRVELIPAADGIKIVKVTREAFKSLKTLEKQGAK